MLYKTHLGLGFAAGLILTGSVAGGAIGAGAALVPDIESPRSYVGRRLPGVSHAAKMAFGHRQALHSLAGSVIFAVIVLIVSKFYPGNYLLPAFAGYVSHLILDTLNPEGVPWLWPLKFRLRLPLTEPGGLLERVVIFPVVMLLSLFLVGSVLIQTILKGV